MPKDESSERVVLASILGSKNNFDSAIEMFAEENPFFSTLHQTLFEVYLKLLKRDEYPDGVNVVKFINTNGLSEIIPVQFIATLLSQREFLDFRQHCRNVRSLHERRKAIILFERLIVDAYLEELPNEEIFDAADVELLRLRTEKKDSEPVKISDLLHHLEKDEAEQGLLTGYTRLDEILNNGAGALGGDYIIIGARPSVGKTTLSLNICAFFLKNNKPVLYFSSEMKNQKMIRKLFEVFSGIPSWKIQKRYNQFRGQLTPEELRTAQQVQERFKNDLCFLDETNGLTPQDLRARISRWKQRYNIAAVFIDYIQLISPSGVHANRDSEVRSISAAIKSMAKEFDIPIFALSQLNRDSTKSDDKRPSVSHLRDGGSLEQDADVIILPYDPVQVSYGNQEEERAIKLIIAKNRLGACTEIPMIFKPKISHFQESDVLIPDTKKQYRPNYGL